MMLKEGAEANVNYNPETTACQVVHSKLLNHLEILLEQGAYPVLRVLSYSPSEGRYVSSKDIIVDQHVLSALRAGNFQKEHQDISLYPYVLVGEQRKYAFLALDIDEVQAEDKEKAITGLIDMLDKEEGAYFEGVDNEPFSECWG